MISAGKRSSECFFSIIFSVPCGQLKEETDEEKVKNQEYFIAVRVLDGLFNILTVFWYEYLASLIG